MFACECSCIAVGKAREATKYEYITIEQHSITQARSNEEKLLEWKETKRGTIAEDKLCGFVDFYMRKDTKQNNGKTIVANWEGDFNPEE